MPGWGRKTRSSILKHGGEWEKPSTLQDYRMSCEASKKASRSGLLEKRSPGGGPGQIELNNNNFRRFLAASELSRVKRSRKEEGAAEHRMDARFVREAACSVLGTAVGVSIVILERGSEKHCIKKTWHLNAGVLRDEFVEE